MKSLSIIQRLAAGFGIIILLLIGIALLALRTGQQLYGQVDILSHQVAPTLVQSRSVTRDLFSQDKTLRYLLGQQEAQIVQRDQSKLQEWQQRFEQDLKDLRKLAHSDATLQKHIDELAEQQAVYWQQASQLVGDYATNLASQQKLREQANLAAPTQRFKADLANMVSSLGANFAVGLSRNLADNLDLLVSNVVDGLGQHEAAQVQRRLDNNRALAQKLQGQRRELADALSKQESAFGTAIDFEGTLGKALDSLLATTTADNGLLGQHLQLTAQSEQLRNQSDLSARIIDTVLADLGDIDKVIDTQLQQGVARTTAVLNSLRMALFASLLVSLAIAGIVLWRIIAAIRTPMRRTLDVLHALGDGDMTRTLHHPQQDEFGHLARGINALAAQMRQMLGEVAQSASELGTVSERNLTTLKQTYHQLEQQRSETAGVAAAMLEMEHTVADVASAAHHSMTEIVRVSDQAAQGRAISDSNIQRINRLAGELGDSQEVIEKVHGLSVNIGGILDVISQIAEQTNLLALNAAIEAARAGEQGRGFAVVADEVRNLARRTAQATTEIQTMITALQQSVSQAVTAIRLSGESMSACTEESEQARQAMDAISTALQHIADMSSQIAAAAEQQQSTSAEIARNLNNINQIADQNQQEIDKVAQTSDQLQQLSASQQTLIHRFTL